MQGSNNFGPEAPGFGRAQEPQSDAADAIPPERHAPPAYRPRYVPLWNNSITILGLFAAAMSLMLLLTFGLFSLISPAANPYVDIIGYLVLPTILAVSLIVVPVGILIKSWRLRRKDHTLSLAFRLPRIDLNDPPQRKVAKWFVGGTFILLPVVGVSAYHGYHFTDSTEFCARACHSVMKPQATTHETSAHARVPCAECHIGSGASWFVKSKLSGTRQVLAMWRESYSRPIPPAISELRPARETCEQCHWPKKFFGAQLREIAHFASDENNTRRDVAMLLKTGGGDESFGRAEGIHLHMALAGRIEYIATDEKLQDIPWIRMTASDGTELIYRSDGKPSSDPKPEGQLRQLDCMDCHNRPAHKFRSPQTALDDYLESGMLDTTLPFIKRRSVELLTTPFPDVETACAQIGSSLRKFYEEQYPQVWERRMASVNQAVDRVREIYRLNFFPSMKVDWRTYPDNIGHYISPGCFRCHEGRHVNQRGETISSDCNACHLFLNPISRNGKDAVVEKGEFIHPYVLEGTHNALRCDQCHTGGNGPLPTCNGCHTTQAQFRAGSLPEFARFEVTAEPMAEVVDCEACHDISQPVSIENLDSSCMECHDDEPERFDGMLETWKREMVDLLRRAEGQLDRSGLDVLARLKTAGPLHNIAASRRIIAELLDQPEKAPSPAEALEDEED